EKLSGTPAIGPPRPQPKLTVGSQRANDCVPERSTVAKYWPRNCPGHEVASKDAVYVFTVCEATMSCVCAPPSDQRAKAQVPPPGVCGDVALMVFREPRITVLVNGVAATVLPTTT